ncbi:adenylate cyclase type 2-like [Ctenocephalides felis]|uniref:adenylate cyclase type 2-like n=1 Tax=Ctenocephalides felis TaxID=7515 RepID=UPI000E6E2548|nr:adenylate cyclase type 2-like [Ctenocephalides felis]
MYIKPAPVEIVVNNDNLPSPNVSAEEDAPKPPNINANGSAVVPLNVDGGSATGEATPPGGSTSLVASSVCGDSKRASLGNCSAGGLSYTGRLSPSGLAVRSRPSSKMTKYVECWGADKPFANITDSSMAKNIGLASIAMIESNLEPSRMCCFCCCGGSGSDWCGRGAPRELKPCTLRYRVEERESMYATRRDDLFRRDVACAYGLFILMAAVLLLTQQSIVICGSLLATAVSLSALLWLSAHGPKSDELQHGGNSATPITALCAGPADIVAASRFLRLAVFGLMTSLIACCAAIGLINFEDNTIELVNNLNSTDIENNEWILTEMENFKNVPTYLHACAISLTTVSVFLRSGFLLKLCVMIIIGLCQLAVIVTSEFAQNYDGFYDTRIWLWALVMFIVLISILHTLDRQGEYTARTDFLWRAKLKVEQDEVETMRGINKILLENILPAHVAQHFLRSARVKEQLYHERYACVAVMFASIPNYKEFYDETDVNKQGLECLRLLNEIICDFDKLLLKPKFSSIEKIKTIGSTYMLASGLRPGKEESAEELKRSEEQTVVVLVEFACALFAALDQINRESFQRFRLRVGLNHGPVIAGVVGAQKPQYDIWGNTVNVASRMDSCGIMGRMQVTESTAKVLMRAGYNCECRGPTYVKGKGTLTTYFIKTQHDNQ